MHPPILLLISDDPHSKPLLEQALDRRRATILPATTIEEGLRILKDQVDLALVLCDESQGRIASQVILSQARRTAHNLPVIILGQDGSAKAAVEALHRGAADYLAQPVTAKDLQTAIHKTHVFEAPEPQAQEERPFAFDQIVSRSPQMKLLKHLAAEVAQTDATTVLITGESGTGKELFAQGIHSAGPRFKGPVVALNCAGIPEHLLESELFGHQRGAFTDAKHTKPGRFQLAEGGTLFLDEIGEMSPSAQAKLLRVLESSGGRWATRAASASTFVGATNEDLPAQIKLAGLLDLTIGERHRLKNRRPRTTRRYQAIYDIVLEVAHAIMAVIKGILAADIVGAHGPATWGATAWLKGHHALARMR
jgi:DNA-binding NtrC family response regulator